MNFFKHYSIVLFISFLLFLIIINIFRPIFMAQNLIFPYAVSKFDIISKFPKIWFYIKIIYCITCFFNSFLAINSIFKFILIKKSKPKNTNQPKKNIDSGNFNLLLGIDSINHTKIYIPEKGLYQNILITGTIGSRKNCFLHVSFTLSNAHI